MVNVSPTKEYNMILPDSNVIQKVYVGSTYLYGLQQESSKSPNIYLYRGVLPDTGEIDVNMTKYMTLTNFGHTETLDYFEYNQQPYFWIGTKPTDNSSATYPWASQVGRLPIDGEDKDGNTSIERISSISSANANGKPAFELLRCEAALSSTNSRLFILGEDAKGNKQLTVYNANTVNRLLDNSATGYVSCQDSSMKTLVADGGALISSHIRSFSYPNKSLQGIEYSDDNKIYISGGAPSDTPKINKRNWQFTQSETASLDLSGSQIETEGIQLKGSKVYVGIEQHLSTDYGNGGHLVYSIPKNTFSF